LFNFRYKKNKNLHHIYLPHAQTAFYDSNVKLFLKQGISHQLGRDAVVRFECENSAIDVIINLKEIEDASVHY
jgi:hypothetical protein